MKPMETEAAKHMSKKLEFARKGQFDSSTAECGAIGGGQDPPQVLMKCEGVRA